MAEHIPMLSVPNAGQTDGARPVLVAPTLMKITNPASQKEFTILYALLQSTDEESSTLATVLASAGCTSSGDLAFLVESDFAAYSNITPMTKRKILLIGEFLQRGGELTDVESINQVLTLVQKARITGTKIVTANLRRIADGSNHEIIELNVGGKSFSTTLRTLRRFPGSYLEVMFSGRHEKPALQGPDGSFFIDRSGTYFQYILDFLRVECVVSLPLGDAAQEELAIEADFYGLHQLVK